MWRQIGTVNKSGPSSSPLLNPVVDAAPDAMKRSSTSTDNRGDVNYRVAPAEPGTL